MYTVAIVKIREGIVSDDFDIDQRPVPSFRKRVLIYGKDWLIAIALTLFGFWAISKWRAPDLPDIAPDFTLETVTGEAVRLSDFRGRTVVLNFWTTWCNFCKIETPDFAQFASDNPEIPVFGIAVETNRALVKATAQKWGMNYPVMLADAQVRNDYQVSTFPTTVIVGPEGKISNVHVGQMLPKQLNWSVSSSSVGCNSIETTP